MGEQKLSIALGEMSLAELVQINQGLGHDIERIRAQRKHLQGHIAQRLAAGEREHTASEGDASAPGALVVAQSSD